MTRDDVQNQALSIILPLDRSGLSVSMRVGKTLIGLKHMDAQYQAGSRKFLVVAPKRAIFKSWKDDAAKFGLDYLLDHITFSTYVGLLKKPIDYNAIYLDEMHALLYSHQVWLDQYKGKILGLTGTAPKWSGSEKGIMVETYCPIVYEYIIDDAVGDGILNDYEIVVHKLQLSSQKNYRKSTKDGRSWMTSELADYTYWTDKIGSAVSVKQEQIMRIMRMKALMTYSTKESYARGLFQSISEKCILFCNTIDQAHKMSAHSYTSKNPKSEKNLEMFQSGEIDKLSCVLQLSEGITIPELGEAILMHSYGNERKASQRIGRILGLSPDKIARAHILCYENSCDLKWVKQALETFDQTKIIWK